MENLKEKTLASMTEEEKKKLRNTRFNLIDNVNTLQSIEVYCLSQQSIEKEKRKNEERLKRFGTYKEEDKLKMRKERFGTYKEQDKLKMRKERFGTYKEQDKLKMRKERFGNLNENQAFREKLIQRKERFGETKEKLVVSKF